jgi:hypothetical protein
VPTSLFPCALGHADQELPQPVPRAAGGHLKKRKFTYANDESALKPLNLHPHKPGGVAKTTVSDADQKEYQTVTFYLEMCRRSRPEFNVN